MVSQTPKKAKKTRAEKSIENRNSILQAAAEVVGELGYAEASIARITQRAGLAQGTFYLYFDSRQALFDELLPHMGQGLLDFLHSRVEGSSNMLDVEERGFRGFFDYLQRNPSFFRVLNEAEVAAPHAYEEHFDKLRSRYVESLERSWSRGQLAGYERRELEVIAYILMAARSYLYLRYSKDESGPKPIPDWVVGAFMKFTKGGMLYRPVESDDRCDNKEVSPACPPTASCDERR